jgi:hypothetical protein
MRASLLSLALGGVLSVAAFGATPAQAEGAADGDSAAVPDFRTEPRGYGYDQDRRYHSAPNQVVVVPPSTTYVTPAPAYAGPAPTYGTSAYPAPYPAPGYAAPGSTTTYVSPNGTTTTTSTTYGSPPPGYTYVTPGTTTYVAPSATYAAPPAPLPDYSQAQPKWNGYDMHRPGVVPSNR